MYTPLLLVCVLVAPGCTTKGDTGEIRNTIHNITNIAKLTLVHIDKLRTKLPAAPLIEVSVPSVEGLTSITRDLGLLDNELQGPFTEPLSQIRADVSSLEGRVRFLAQITECHISETRAEAIDTLFPDSYLHQTLTKVQKYLQKFLLNKDKLKVC